MLQNHVLGYFSHFRVSKCRFLIANRKSVTGDLRYRELISGIMSTAIDSTSPQLASFSRHDATFLRQYATVLRQDATLLLHDATFSRTFVNVAKSNLRQIAFYFLTNGIRVGDCDPRWKSHESCYNIASESPSEVLS